MIALLLAAVVADAAPPPAPDPAAQLAELHVLYQQSCEVRAYASYDDVCDSLRKEVRNAERDLAKAAKAKPSAPPAGGTLAVTPSEGVSAKP